VAKLKNVTVFCGSGLGNRPAYAEGARAFGRLVAERGLTIVYGGGRSGLMGELADAALGAGGTVVGIIPEHLFDREVGHTGITDLVVVRDMHARKAMLAARGDCFVTLPGGSGTLEEFFEAWTWRRIGLHDKPIGFLNTDGYWSRLVDTLTNMADAGFLDRQDLDDIVVEADPVRLLDRLDATTSEEA
jgi:uncharacterized protein (TIGR00730 family)